MNKTLYLIRHGLSLHNELFYKIGVDAFKHSSVIDAPLIQDGHIQSITLGNNWKNKNKIDLVLVSPLTRTLDTCMNIFGSSDVNIECYEFLREYPIGEDTCNKRSSLLILKDKYPKIKFNLLYNNDVLWREDKRETIEELEIRIKDIKEFVKKRKEKHIAIISHSSLIGKFKDNHIPYKENGDEELKYCYPYEYKL